MKRPPLRKVSKRRARVNRERAKILEQHFGPREGWRCWIKDRPAAVAIAGTCSGFVSAHEILKRSRAGSTDANLLDVKGQELLCSKHQTWVEDHPIEANKLGLAKHAWET